MSIKTKIILFLICTLMACKKDDVAVMEQNLLKVVNLDGDYFARNCKELPDGSIIIACVAKEDPSSGINFGLLPSYLIKYSKDGALIWKIILPSEVHVVHDFIILKNGNFFITGSDVNPNSQLIGFVVLDENGNSLAKKSYFFQTNTLGGQRINIAINAIQLSNNNIAIAVPVATTVSIYIKFTQLVILDESLNMLTSKLYTPDNIVKYVGVSQLSIAVDKSDNLFISGEADKVFNSASKSRGFIMKLGAPDFNPVYFETYANLMIRTPSNIDIVDESQTVWTTSGPANTDSIFNHNFILNSQEEYGTGPDITVYKSNGDTALRKKVTITGYPKYGYTSKIVACKDGGFALLGTCNINVNQGIPSEYRLLIIKLDRNLQVEWMKYPDIYPSVVAASIQEIENGFLISASHFSFGKKNKPIFFKLSPNGLIQ